MPQSFSSRTAWPSQENPLSQKLQALRAAGHPIIDLTESNPTHCGFSYLSPDLLKPLGAEESLVYDPSPRGLASAREAVRDYYAAKGIRLELSQIFLTASTSEAYHFLFRLLANPGDSILVPKPGYPLLEYLGGLNDVTVMPFKIEAQKNWSLELKSMRQAASPKAFGVLLVNPNNPTGHFISPEDRKTVNRFCRERELALLADEVFLDYAWGQNPGQLSFAGSSEVLTFTLSGISKILGLPQMKLSWIIVSGPQTEREEAIRRLEIIADAYLSVNTPVQRALPVWLKSAPKITGEILERVQENFRTLQEHPDFQRLGGKVPEGGWYALLDLPESKSDEDWALHVLVGENVLFHPGYLFDFEDHDRAVISLLPPPDLFREGLRRLLRRLD